MAVELASGSVGESVSGRDGEKSRSTPARSLSSGSTFTSVPTRSV